MECDTWRQHLASMETRHAEAEKLWNQEKGHLQRQLEQKENVNTTVPSRNEKIQMWFVYLS